jgi:small subunit ribosomal protein S13
MFRIFGRPLNTKYKLLPGLSRVYGIGKSRAGNIIADLGLSPGMRIDKLTSIQKKQITDWLKNREISPSEIKKDRRDSIVLLQNMKNYRGFRHKNRYPVRGQRTKTNAKTQKRMGDTHKHL